MVFKLVVLNLYLALCTVGNFGPFGQLCGGCVGTRYFRTSRALPPLPVGSVGSGVSCLGWFDEIAAG